MPSSQQLTKLVIAQFVQERSIRQVITEIQQVYPEIARSDMRKHIHNLKNTGFLEMPRDEVYRATKLGKELVGAK